MADQIAQQTPARTNGGAERVGGRGLRYRRIVAKVGTATLTGGAAELDQARMAGLVAQVAALMSLDAEVLLVTSGAIAAGRARLGASAGRRDIPYKQVLAAVGQPILMQRYEALFAQRGLIVGQALLTRADLSARQGYLNARTTLLAMLEQGIVPVVNENDAVAVEEMKFGENDTLSAMVANVVDADALVMLTDTGGLYTADPRRDAAATLIAQVRAIDRQIERLAGGAGTAQGSGGMRTKIDAAKLAMASGIDVLVVPGHEPDSLLRVVCGEPIGTRFVATPDPRVGRQRWILSALAGRGRIVVDAGAANALVCAGRSLLAPGVVAVEGRFRRGDPVTVLNPSGARIACGLVNYAAADLDVIKGQHSHRIEELLGFAFGDEVIHRNNLVLLAQTNA
jgi:glutamate 5-kinase